MAKKRENESAVDGVGLDVHGSEPIAHQFTIYDADGNADVEFNFSFPLTPKRHAQLARLLEEGYTEHDAYVLLAHGEILAHIEAMKKAKGKGRKAGGGEAL
jgi:hypothetical protein